MPDYGSSSFGSPYLVLADGRAVKCVANKHYVLVAARSGQKAYVVKRSNDLAGLRKLRLRLCAETDMSATGIFDMTTGREVAE